MPKQIISLTDGTTTVTYFIRMDNRGAVKVYESNGLDVSETTTQAIANDDISNKLATGWWILMAGKRP